MHLNIPTYFLVTDQGGVLSMSSSMVTEDGVQYVEELRNREIEKLHMYDFSFIKAFGVIDGGKKEQQENV